MFRSLRVQLIELFSDLDGVLKQTNVMVCSRGGLFA